MDEANQLLPPGGDGTDAWVQGMALRAAASQGDDAAVAQLLAAGADPEAVAEPDDPTALMIAAERGDLALVRRLVDAGANVSATAEDHELDRLLGTNPAVTDAVGTLVWPLLYADLAGHPAVVDYLAPRTAPALQRDLDRIRSILRRWRQPVRDRRLKHLLAAVEADRLDEVKRLLAAGVPVQAQDRSGCSALAHAAALDRLDHVQWLLAAGADPTAATDERLTPLHLTRDPTIARLLVAAGGDPNAPDRFGMTPLHYAAWAKPALMVVALLSLGASVNQTDDDGETALIKAVTRRQADAFVPLLAAGADATPLAPHGRTLWELADLVRVGDALRGAWRTVHGTDPPG